MKTPDPHYRHRFPVEIISLAVWLYHAFSLSMRDVELILAKRGVVVSYETVRRWCMKFASSFADRLRGRRSPPGDKWYMEEVFIRIQGVQHYRWGAVDQDCVHLRPLPSPSSCRECLPSNPVRPSQNLAQSPHRLKNGQLGLPIATEPKIRFARNPRFSGR
jgi:hypothetical protein